MAKRAADLRISALSANMQSGKSELLFQEVIQLGQGLLVLVVSAQEPMFNTKPDSSIK